MKVLDLPGLKQFNTKINSLIDKRIEKAMISHVLDSANTSMVLGADVGPKIMQQINAVDQKVTDVSSDLSKIKFQVAYVDLPAGQDWYYPDIWIPTYVQWLPVVAVVQDCLDTQLAITQAKFSESGQLFIRFNQSLSGNTAVAIQAIFKSP